MPIEIRELVIKATVGHEVPAETNRNGSTSNNGGGLSATEKKAIIEECVERVLNILQKQKER